MTKRGPGSQLEPEESAMILNQPKEEQRGTETLNWQTVMMSLGGSEEVEPSPGDRQVR